jgi:hypothetical protein
MLIEEDNVDGVRSVDLSGVNISGGYAVGYWVGPSTTELGAGYSADLNGTDPNSNASSSTGGVGDGNSPTCLQGMFFTQYIANSQPFTFDIGYFSPLGTLRLSYKINIWKFP